MASAAELEQLSWNLSWEPELGPAVNETPETCSDQEDVLGQLRARDSLVKTLWSQKR